MKPYILQFKIAFLSLLEYRFRIFFNILIKILGALSTYFLWKAITDDFQNIGRYNFKIIFTYFILSIIFRTFNATGIAKRMEELVKSGNLSNYLSKPIKTNLLIFFEKLGENLLAISISLIIFFPILIILNKNGSITFQNIYWIVLFSLLSKLYLYLLYLNLGLFAFWLTNIGGLRTIFWNVINILRGGWFPIDIAPYFIQTIFALLPFQYAMYYPIKLFTDNPTLGENLKGILILIFYCIIHFSLARLLWKKGVRRFEAVGN